jgi:hypothetical protein
LCTPAAIFVQGKYAQGTSDLALHDVIDALATARITWPVKLPKAAR